MLNLETASNLNLHGIDSSIDKQQRIDDYYKNLCQIILTTHNEIVAQQRVIKKNNSNRWWTNELSQQKQKMRNIYNNSNKANEIETKKLMKTEKRNYR